ncbi:hypothetical protein SNOG_12054 [Parastagonospora nodorum SN15]|uniref:Uncharacterized protein n=1 Tax=Phaeosphaeria nodorum (strain SN15 / ATCC MYA-4574 / FGSC 10173) TaxID=321614 RepID=Q0U860_PHANO|nr:hypothetical protein SNOG_12054 [Parastagonospora nodorum SN15]EAT80466.1 hypothetical protein SNOG_12054 [Parastagonospora nodorum SN15]
MSLLDMGKLELCRALSCVIAIFLNSFVAAVPSPSSWAISFGSSVTQLSQTMMRIASTSDSE